MPRNRRFSLTHKPLRHSSLLELQDKEISGTFSFLNPTRAVFQHAELEHSKTSPSSKRCDELKGDRPDAAVPSKDEQAAYSVKFAWRSRDNRKGRHLLQIKTKRFLSRAIPYIIPQKTSSFRAIRRGLLRMVAECPYWDVSYLVAIIFTLGSVIWVVNAFFAWLPLAVPSTEFHNETFTGGGVTAFIGATIFEIGSVLLFFEAVNENNSGCFGWALEKAFSDEHGGNIVRVKPSKENCSHHHTNKRNIVGKATDHSQSSDHDGKAWQWYPSWQALTTHYFRELGFLASLSQFCGASIFWISGFTALPGIINHLSQGLEDGIFWTPQIVGGIGFIISGGLFMLETQPNWYTPAPHVLGWHIGLWNLIGAVGFTLCGALGPASGNSGAQYQSSLATFWGSWAFLIGSVIQWYESLDKHPVEEDIDRKMEK